MKKIISCIVLVLFIVSCNPDGKSRADVYLDKCLEKDMIYFQDSMIVTNNLYKCKSNDIVHEFYINWSNYECDTWKQVCKFQKVK